MLTRRIDSIENPKLKQILALHKKKYRDRENLFFVEGIRLCEEAIKQNWDIVYAIYADGIQLQERQQRLLDTLLGKKCPVYEVSQTIFHKIADTDTPQGILLVLKKRQLNIAAMDRMPFYILLDHIQDPGNLGTIIRTAAAAKVQAIFLTHGCVDVFSPKVLRSTMGALFSLPIFVNISEEKVLKIAKEKGLKIFSSSLDGTAREYFDENYTDGVMLIFGNEGAGISPFLLENSQKIYIPMAEGMESLNVAAASAIALYEVVRQRRSVSFQQI